jgi:hypothetical protein
MKYLITSLIITAISAWVVAISPSPVHDSTDIVASMRDNVYESITLKLGDGCTVDEIAREYNANRSFYDNLKDNEVQTFR